MICVDCGELRHPGRDCMVKECPECFGEGQREEEYEVGGYTPDRWMELKVRWVECEACRGRGEVAEETLDSA